MFALTGRRVVGVDAISGAIEALEIRRGKGNEP